MSFTFEQVEALLERQEKRYEQFQMRVLEILTRQMNLTQKRLSENTCTSHADSLINSINQFHFEYLAGSTSDSWSKEYKDLFKVNPVKTDDAVPIMVSQVAVTLPELNAIESPCMTEVTLPYVPSISAPENGLLVSAFVDEAEQETDAVPIMVPDEVEKENDTVTTIVPQKAVASPEIDVIESPCARAISPPQKTVLFGARSMACSPSQEAVLSNLPKVSAVYTKKLKHSARRSIKPREIGTVSKVHAKRGQVISSLIYPRSCNNVDLKTMHSQNDEMLTWLPRKDPTIFRGGGY
ncbi:hypothetical protein MN116_000468 [Schistosoma mekongi]|uniref:Uncharacterized protein n=1 Tax=Schistosoma mekongi TaxID=38744 RepID=A0AAE1ZE25_SCHME|nr:hypothetical protein MN116_000468 [Schistosoma mekongi]